MSFKSFVEDSERFIEEICCTTQGDMNLLESLLPAPFLMQGLKTAVMFIHHRVLCIQDETIDGCHTCLPFARSRQHGIRICIWTAMIRRGYDTVGSTH